MKHLSSNKPNVTRTKIIVFLASACIALCASLLCSMAAHADLGDKPWEIRVPSPEDIYIVLPTGKSEPAMCVNYGDVIVCESRHAVCKVYTSVDTQDCFWKPIKN